MECHYEHQYTFLLALIDLLELLALRFGRKRFIIILLLTDDGAPIMFPLALCLDSDILFKVFNAGNRFRFSLFFKISFLLLVLVLVFKKD